MSGAVLSLMDGPVRRSPGCRVPSAPTSRGRRVKRPLGQSIDTFEFVDFAPGRDDFVRALRPYVDPSGIEGYDVDGRRVELSCALDPYTRPYACALLCELGGRIIDPASGAPGDLRLPWYASLPRSAMPLGVRVKIGLDAYRHMLSPPRHPATGIPSAEDAGYHDTAPVASDPETGLVTIDRVYRLDWDRFTSSHDAALQRVYRRLPGARCSVDALPGWYGRGDAPPSLEASVEPSGLQVTGELPPGAWEVWDRRFRELTSGFPRKALA